MRRIIAISAAVGFLGSVSLTAAMACTGQPASASVATPTAEEAKAPTAEKAKAPTHRLSVTPLTLAVGKTGAVTLKITPAKGFKVNKDYPTKVTLSAPTKVSLDKMVFKKADAKIAGGTLTMVMGAKGKVAGEETITAQAKFSICNETTCLLEKATVRIRVVVK